MRDAAGTVRLLNSDQPPTAIFTVDDLTCAQSAASEMNITVPGRLSLVG
ncbi:MAG: hypothetical protein ACRDOH_07985 [Streptosporangiaceae bacterium]